MSMHLSYTHVVQPELSIAATLPEQHCIHNRAGAIMSLSQCLCRPALSYPTKP